VKEAVFPFARFPGVDVTLKPEMRSTGEVMGVDLTAGMAFLKSQLAAGNRIPSGGGVFLSVRDEDKPRAVALARELADLGFAIFATAGTSTALRDNGIRSRGVFRLSEGRPHVLDLIEDKEIGWVINTPATGAAPRADEVRMRAHAVIRGIPITTTIDGLRAAINGLKTFRAMGRMEVCSLQEYHRRSPKTRTRAGDLARS